MTMAVHVGKLHSENIVCGICDFVADNLDNLETHLFTCEMYQCYYDNENFKNLSDLKEQVKKSMQKTTNITHLFMLNMEEIVLNKLSAKLTLYLNFSQNFCIT
jgi:hypothetical protein